MTGNKSVDVERLMVGDETVFQALFIDYYPALVSFAKKYVERDEVAEDIVQGVFVKVWEGRDGLRGVENLSAYLYQMVRFRCFNHLRAEKVRFEASRSYTNEMDVSEMYAYIKEETFRIVMRAVDELPAGSRNVFSRTLQGFSAKEIAEELGIAVETVKKQKQIARRQLKEKLGKLLSFLFIS